MVWTEPIIRATHYFNGKEWVRLVESDSDER